MNFGLKVIDGLGLGLGLILASVAMRLLFHVGFCG